jgi:hypothetical protein
MKVTVVKKWKDSAEHTVRLQEGCQTFYLDYQGTRTECAWYARMFRIALHKALLKAAR